MKIRNVLSAGAAAALALSISIVVVPLAHADTTTPGSFNLATAVRVLDTRSGLGASETALGPNGTLTFVATKGITSPVGEVTLTVTAVDPTKRGYLTVYAAGTPIPKTSNLNYQAGETTPNMVVTKVGADGKVSIFNGSAGSVEVLADLQGYFLAGTGTAPGTLVPMDANMNATRVLDTRIGLGAKKDPVGSAPLTFKVAGQYGIPANATAVVMNLTATGGLGNGYVTASAAPPVVGAPLIASALNYVKNRDRANLVLQGIGADGTITLVNGSATTVDLVADVTGYFVGGTPAADGAFIPTAQARAYDSRSAGDGLVAAGSVTKVQIFPANDPTFAYIKAVVINVTAFGSQQVGYLTTWNSGKAPFVSNVNFQAHQDASGEVMVPVSKDGTVSIYNGSKGQTGIAVDVTGYFYALPQQ